MGVQRLLILGHTWPEPKATAAGVRMMQLISYFKDSNWDITFACTSTHSDNSEDLKALGICFQQIQVNDDKFDSFLQELQPSVVLFDRYITEEQFGWRVLETLPNCIRILDTEDLHSLRLAREQAIKNNTKFSVVDWLRLDQTKRELASIYRSDLSLIISSYEIKLLKDEIGVPLELLLYLPFWSSSDKKSLNNNPGFSAREGFIFIGNGRHKPNIDAIQYLNSSIWPIVRSSMPEARLDIYGAYLPENIKAMHNPKQKFYVRGYIDDAEKVMQMARVNLVPLRYGAGLKGKVLMALEQGTPTVSTAIGLEGILDNSQDNNTFDEPMAFAKEAVRLYSEEEFWHKKQDSGYGILESNFSALHFRKDLSERLKSLTDHLQEHRLRNFVGSMLHYHCMQSTKYLSKWITLKNELKIQDKGI